MAIVNTVKMVKIRRKKLYPAFLFPFSIYNIDPLKPHFYIVKLGFTGVYIIFLISAQNIDCGYSLEPLSVFGGEIFNIFE